MDRMIKKSCVVLSLILVTALFLGGCGPKVDLEGQGGDGPFEGGMITYGITGDPVIFNPILSTGGSASIVIDRVFNGLVKPNENLEMVGDLAESWTFSDDGLVWTFKLKKASSFTTDSR